MSFPSVSPKQSFPALESEVLAYWKANNTFQKSIDSRPEDNPYRFYDGPPFITGTPHYGSLLSSIVKDVVGRYWTMRGKRVDRVWGWDCHGLPIEEKVQKKLGLSSNKEIEERGVKEFIDGCYEYTQSTSAEWDWYIDKIGRWVDMDRAYRTMDQDYMESVMWVFKQLWDKGLVYEGKRVSLYSWKLSTPISNFEVAMDDTYQEVNDPAITVKFRPEFTYGAFVFVTNSEWKLLLGKHKKSGTWKIPGGKFESGETKEQCLEREAFEETGLRITDYTPLNTSVEFLDGVAYYGYAYVANIGDVKVVENSEPEKFEEWKFFTIDEVQAMKSDIAKYDHEALEVFLGERKPILEIKDFSLLAWTTTPWTIPANMALAVRNDIDYVLVENGSEQFIVAKNRAESVFKGKWEYIIIREFKWSELVGLGYVPPFPEYYYQKNGEKNHKIYHADFITDTDGTGIGHEAPEFGDVDFQLAKKEGIFISEAMDEAGKYTSQIFDYEWLHYQEANKVNIERMKENGTLFKNESITHRVPFCPRSGTPLVQKAQASWFIDIQSQKEKLLQANKQINWFPEHLKFGRFAKGIEAAPDWCISRTRYWGAPMPVWMGDDGEKVVVGSREEIFELNKPYGQLEKREVDGKVKYFFTSGEFAGQELNLHKPYIDAVKLQSPKTGNELTRIPEVLDVWMDSGSMPYAQVHFPFAGFEDTSIRKVETGTEKEECFQFFKKIWKNEFEIDFEKNPRRTLGDIKNEFFESEIYAIFENSNIVSCIQVMNQTKESEYIPAGGKLICRVATLEEFRGKGLGTKLIKKALSQLAKQWEKEVYLNAEITNINYYKGFGFEQIQETPVERWNTESVYMKKSLSKADELQSLVFPADFIAEYVGQVRAWFYVMHVLGVLLNLPHPSPLLKERGLGTDSPSLKEKGLGDEVPRPAFTNVITTGVINGNDGRKMSKSYGNYPDPRETIEKYGADPIRFYMLNSPLLSGGDMDFKEEGIIETIKSVMLPLWNTYSFFTTYANIDKWEKDNTEVWFSRHAESTSNVAGKMSDGSDNPELTEKGRQQAKNAGITLREQGINFDVIIHTDRIRARDTARAIGEATAYTGEYIIDDGFAEQTAGEYANMTLTEIAQKHGLPVDVSHIELRKIYKNNSTENLEQFEVRIMEAYRNVLEKYNGKRVLIVAHAGTSRPMLANYMGMDKDRANYDTTIKNADPYQLMTTPIVNPLDRWILSKLQVLIGKVHDAMDGYDVSRATRSIVEYMDELTNWYVRLSRRRFWGSEMTPDKQSGYETLYTVLVEVSKLLAPYMPFMTESIYKGLTDKNVSVIARNEAIQVPETAGSPRSARDDEANQNSVHLTYITRPNPHLIDTDLNHDMELAEHIVSLGLALRSRKNIRVRQPLSSITITSLLDEYYQSIIRDELNVKAVRFENPEKLAKKICKPDARKIGPKYGKDVQKVIVEAKNGNFVEKEDGVIDVEGFILESWEYTMEYLPLEWAGDVEGGYGIVVAMDTIITEELKLEGYARDIIRQIQDMRKEADYQVTDRISLHIAPQEGSEAGITHDLVANILSNFTDIITHETLSTFSPLMSSPDLEKELELDEGVKVMIQIEK